MILVDSNIFIRFAKQGLDPVAELRNRYELSILATCGVVQAEVLRGIRYPKRQKRIVDFFSLVQRIPTPSSLWDEITELAWNMDRKGFVLPLPDLIVAACALRARAAVLTCDQHFSKIPDLWCWIHESIPDQSFRNSSFSAARIASIHSWVSMKLR